MITDELRKWGYGFCGDTHDVVTAIADRIDAEHEKAMSRAGQLLADAEQDRDSNYANWQECKQKVLQSNITVNELSAETEGLRDELSCRIELPKDADGEYIHVGDELRDEWQEQNQGEVEWLMLDHHGWWFMLKNDYERFYAHEFHEWRHRCHRVPTVEDVLQELVVDWDCAPDGEDKAAVLKEYAAKLQLKEDE